MCARSTRVLRAHFFRCAFLPIAVGRHRLVFLRMLFFQICSCVPEDTRITFFEIRSHCKYLCVLLRNKKYSLA